MVMHKLLLTSAAASLGVAAPAAACDQHGPGQMGGFHRYNPFANAFNNIQSGAHRLAKSDVAASRDTSEKRKADKKKREKALDAEAEAEKARKADLRERQQQGRGALK